MDTMTTFRLNCPDSYREKLFLTPCDLMSILGIGESLAYAYLRDNPPFRVEKIGAKVFIFANSFWNWYNLGANT